ncbi:MAG: hypothetical protein JO184_06795 [Gammaproteobacteria bacterium]|nr:hypothetical protein [Gammaproteobacteria bacterium]MBV8402773.1 hypothetical protein [Gammaproteobacteria bacterium]
MAQEYPPSGLEQSSPSDDGGRLGTLKSKAQEAGAKAAQRADQARVGAAAGLESMASTLHEKGDRVASAAHSAADAVSYGAEYLRDNDMQTMLSDLMEVIRRNPGPSLIGAAALGFMLGRALSRD